MTSSRLSQGNSYFNGHSRQHDRIVGKQFGGTDFHLVAPYHTKSS